MKSMCFCILSSLNSTSLLVTSNQSIFQDADGNCLFISWMPSSSGTIQSTGDTYEYVFKSQRMKCNKCRERGKTCDDISALKESEGKLGQTAQSLLVELQATLDYGFEHHAMQRVPHLVLLDTNY